MSKKMKTNVAKKTNLHVEMRNLKMIIIEYAKIMGIPGMMTGKIVRLSAIYVEVDSVSSALESSMDFLNTRLTFTLNVLSVNRLLRK